MTAKKILYIDLDNTIVDFGTGIAAIGDDLRVEYDGHLDDVPGIFALTDPMSGALDAYARLAESYDTYILSTAPWDNPSTWQHKVEWVHQHLGSVEGTPAYKRLILSHHKHLNRGDYLIDDRPNNGASEFEGEWVKFGAVEYPDWPAVPAYPDWPAVTAYLLPDPKGTK